MAAALPDRSWWIVVNARRHLRHRPEGLKAGRLVATIDELETLIERTERVLDQTRQRLAGEVPAASSRFVSLHDPDARPIRKGMLGKPVEFGYKAHVFDNDDGIVLDHVVKIGNPPDAPMLVPAIERIARRGGSPPNAVTADRATGKPALTGLSPTTSVSPTSPSPSRHTHAATAG